MRLLLDTHVLIWALNEPDRLPRRYEELLSDRAHEVFVGTVSSWEIVTKVTIGRLQFPLSRLATIIEETASSHCRWSTVMFWLSQPSHCSTATPSTAC